MPIKLKTIAVHDESTLKDLVEWAKALKGGAAGIAQKVCTDLAVAAIKSATASLHTYQIENQVDGMLRWKKGNEWRVFTRTGRFKVTIIYQFADRQGKVTQVPYYGLARAINGKIEVAILNPKTGMTMKTIRTKTKARQVSAGEWAVEYWPTY